MILFFDSGVGGLAYLDESLRREPDVPVCYLADTAFFPYGERPPGDVRARVVSTVLALTEQEPIDAIVLACNTASVVALAALRERVSIPIVGVVPAVKPAVTVTRTNHIAVLSTTNTARDPYTDALVRKFAGVVAVTRLGVPRLVTAAEEHICGDVPETLREIIRSDVRDRLDSEVDTVVLACTHFIRLRSEIATMLGAHRTIVDSLDGVIRRLHAVIRKEKILVRGSTETHPVLYTTGPVPERLSCLPMDLRRFDPPSERI